MSWFLIPHALPTSCPFTPLRKEPILLFRGLKTGEYRALLSWSFEVHGKTWTIHSRGIRDRWHDSATLWWSDRLISHKIPSTCSVFDPFILAKSWSANLWLGLASTRFCRSYCGALLRWIWHCKWSNDLIQRLPLFIQKFGLHVCLQSWLWNSRSENWMSEWEMENPDAKRTCVAQRSHVLLRCYLWIKSTIAISIVKSTLSCLLYILAERAPRVALDWVELVC